MSKFTEEMYATAAVTDRGLVTGEPDNAFRQTWGDIHQEARRMAGGLAEVGIDRGVAIGILAGQPVDIAPACQATWMRGASVTMLHQPTPRTDLGVWAQDTETVIDMISAKAVILGAPFDAAKPLLEERGITVVTVDELRSGTSIDPVETAESDIALQQLTSGSTGSPKAVQITHENFYTNAYAMINRIKFSIEDDVMVSWLPLFHDMGMVGFLTVPMQVGAEVISITPMDFLRTPVLWAELMGKYGGTVTAAPNFAYSLLARRLAQAEDGAVDLSSVRYMWNGAEPVDPDTMDALAEAGARFGLNPTALAPVYGMAETTLAVSIPDPDQGQVLDYVDPDFLESMSRAVPSNRPNARALATLGKMVPDLEGRIVDRDGQVLPARGVGIIEVRGKAVTPGYVTVDGHKPAQDADGWLDTGDVGYFTEEGLVVVCGRVKDVIIMGGRNVYPTDIERAAGTVAGVRPGNAVAIRLDAGQKRESFAVAVETNAFEDPEEVKRIEREVVHAVVADVGVRPRAVAVLGPGSIPKTSSGKLRRANSAALLGN
ncbi:fatty acyl-AMP ligase [Rhodococcus qingshengii]|uniref:Long-chain-fatty-acid--CoA ligase n=2 Tax=Rhodococcus erythropolis group TaxID=2840174 RepID=A0A1Q4K3E5_RHOER|nr:MULTISPECIES: fatty acyl-AMP ligase [Rhodococcus]ANQ69731.1 long-chain fatty acid--CoA ligase [Rhodococcus sp. 008]EME23819.1 long-chain-fatty-acid--CoA ligase [Rhodococcus qingshengii BKS 20-40]KPH15489.1 long-chain fatty acid--CoA ligase [Rhodococcus sp. ADH]MBP1048656.1 fatty acyl-AMP ligase [Rhodococcus qingshengii]MBQ7809147.1 fatty acyl-AMP ligase [Rhodococcus sp. (in: high G+C Gram-positive bacteria)]